MAPRSLSTYKAKRDFSKTPEPVSSGPSLGNMFVVQHHWATREHYDFRLELDGVLLSWAVTRGPSFNPADKRLSVRTEDHPISYGDFEGTIPEGNYGAGTVMLWDTGTWEPTVDPRKGLREGSLKFRLDGERLKGNWALVRMRGDGKRENWLLVKERDEHARKDPGIEKFKASVKTGRTRQEIEMNKPPAERRARKAPAKRSPGTRARPKSRNRNAPDLPPFIPPMMCELHKEPPPGPDWLHETKLDGYRLEAALHGASVRLYTREGLDWTARFPTIAEALGKLKARQTLVDGEAVVFDQAGLTDFAALVQSLKEKTPNIAYVAFDILMRNGRDLRAKPLRERKKELERAMAKADGVTLRLSSFIEAEGPLVFEKAAALGAEGIVSKRTSSLYESRRSPNWIKTKTARREDFIIIGYKPSERRQFSSLLAAAEDAQGLKYVGGVGTGFDMDELERTRQLLQSLERSSRPPVAALEKAPRKAHWVEPVLRAEVEFQGWTSDGQLRQARFLGWREDRSPGRNIMPTKNAKRAPARASKSSPPPPRRSARLPPVPAMITHAERVVFPQSGFTKGDAASFYLAVAERIMPHLRGRPISFVRAPEGLSGETFFQRHQLPGMTSGIRRIPDPEGEHKDFVAIENAEGLITAAQFGVIELHGWGARLPRLDRPDRVVLDLDPDPAVKFASVRDAAFELRELLKGIEMESFPLITGGKGVHVVIPLDASQTWDEITDFASGLARGLASADPDRFIATASKDKRKGRIYIDWLRNRLTASAILPWSLRAKPNASVAVPVTWTELKRLDRADAFDLNTAPSRKDPWAEKFFATRQRINPKVLDYLKSVLGEVKKEPGRSKRPSRLR